MIVGVSGVELKRINAATGYCAVVHDHVENGDGGTDSSENFSLHNCPSEVGKEATLCTDAPSF